LLGGEVTVEVLKTPIVALLYKQPIQGLIFCLGLELRDTGLETA
jgi:hypothetical protein